MSVRFVTDEHIARALIAGHQRVAEDRPMPGVLVVPTRMPTGVAIAELASIAAASESEEWDNRVVYLSLR